VRNMYNRDRFVRNMYNRDRFVRNTYNSVLFVTNLLAVPTMERPRYVDFGMQETSGIVAVIRM
jgi:hypothetical protein